MKNKKNCSPAKTISIGDLFLYDLSGAFHKYKSKTFMLKLKYLGKNLDEKLGLLAAKFEVVDQLEFQIYNKKDTFYLYHSLQFENLYDFDFNPVYTPDMGRILKPIYIEKDKRIDKKVAII